MKIIKSIEEFISANSQLDREDIMVDVLPKSSYEVVGTISTGRLTVFVGFNEQPYDAAVYAELIYKWAESQGECLRQALQFESLRINTDTWDYYFTFDWLDKVDIGEPGQHAERLITPNTIIEPIAVPDSIDLNNETLNNPHAVIEPE